MLNITFYKSGSIKSFTIRPTQHCEKHDVHVWLENELGEGGQFDADGVADVIYNALERYFMENH